MTIVSCWPRTICACCPSVTVKSAPFYMQRFSVAYCHPGNEKCSWKYKTEARTRKSLSFISETFIDLRDTEIRHRQRLQSEGG